jgi:hypothetical protein
MKKIKLGTEVSYLYPHIILRSFLLFKGTVSRDFLLLVFFMDQLPPSPRVFHLDRFEFFRKFAEIFVSQCAPPVSTTPVANLPPVSTTPAAKLPAVSTTPVANFSPIFASAVDTGGKFATGVNDTGGKFATGVNDAGANFATGINDTGGKFATGVVDTDGK